MEPNWDEVGPELLEALKLLEGWVSRVVEPTYNARNPMPENLEIALQKSREAIGRTE